MEQFDFEAGKPEPIELKPIQILGIIIVVVLLFIAFFANNDTPSKTDNTSFGATKEFNIECTQDEYTSLWKSLEDLLVLSYRYDPSLIRSLSPHEFEDFIAFLLYRKGYKIEVTPRTKDGGKDIIAKYKMPAGNTVVCYVECKHYSEGRKVGVLPVRALYGVINAEKITCALLVTSTKFSKGAKDFKTANCHLIDLIDIDNIHDWLLS